jgi:hypothetical protein
MIASTRSSGISMAEATQMAVSKKDEERVAAEAAERRLAKQLGIIIPVGTLLVALVLGVATTLAPAILALTAGALIGTIAILWASLRTLGGDAPLPEALEHELASNTDVALGGKKTMLLRALKDLENERDLGKITAEDFESVAERYRDELKDILRALDAEVGPYRAQAEALAKAHLESLGKPSAPKAKKAKKAKPVSEPKAEVAAPAEDAKADEDDDAEGDETDDAAPDSSESDAEASDAAAEPARRECPACHASNEVDAKFCKECAAPLGAAAPATEPANPAPAKEEAKGEA